MSDTVTAEDIDDFLTNAAWAIRSTHHTVLDSSPGAAIFGRDMLFDIPYLADWKAIGERRKSEVSRNNRKENNSRVEYDYAVGHKVLLRQDGIKRKGAPLYIGPYTITQVYVNSTTRIQYRTISKGLNIKRVIPYFE